MTTATQTATKMFADNATYADIGTTLGVSRQRAQQLIQPRPWVIAALKLRADSKCERCHAKISAGHAHHKSRSARPLNHLRNLEYLCRGCHRKAHKDDIVRSQITELKVKNIMAKTLTAVRFPDAELNYLKKWVDRENEKGAGRWTVSYLVQRAVHELIERDKK